MAEQLATIRKRGNGNYYEGHHILPKCLGGTNEKANIVLLTGKEHFICHQLLVAIHTEKNAQKRLLYALFKMSGNPNHGYKVTARTYERFRYEYACLMKLMRLDPKSAYNTPECKAKFKASIAKVWEDPERHRIRSEISKRLSNDPDGVYQTQEYKDKITATLKKIWEDKDSVFHSQEWKDAHKAGVNTDEYRKQRSEIATALRAEPNSKYHSEECRLKKSEATKRLWNDPNSIYKTDEYKAKRRAIYDSPEWQEKCKLARIKRKQEREIIKNKDNINDSE